MYVDCLGGGIVYGPVEYVSSSAYGLINKGDTSIDGAASAIETNRYIMGLTVIIMYTYKVHWICDVCLKDGYLYQYESRTVQAMWEVQKISGAFGDETPIPSSYADVIAGALGLGTGRLTGDCSITDLSSSSITTNYSGVQQALKQAPYSPRKVSTTCHE